MSTCRLFHLGACAVRSHRRRTVFARRVRNSQCIVFVRFRKQAAYGRPPGIRRSSMTTAGNDRARASRRAAVIQMTEPFGSGAVDQQPSGRAYKSASNRALSASCPTCFFLFLQRSERHVAAVRDAPVEFPFAGKPFAPIRDIPAEFERVTASVLTINRPFFHRSPPKRFPSIGSAAG